MQGSSFAGMTSGDADMADMDYRRPWYHSSQQRLAMLRAGNSITQYKRGGEGVFTQAFHRHYV